MKKNRPQRRRGALLTEMLVTVAILSLVGANYFTVFSDTITKAKWQNARLMESTFNTEYSKWTQLGGTHSGPYDPTAPTFTTLSGASLQFKVTQTDTPTGLILAEVDLAVSDVTHPPSFYRTDTHFLQVDYYAIYDSSKTPPDGIINGVYFVHDYALNYRLGAPREVAYAIGHFQVRRKMPWGPWEWNLADSVPLFTANGENPRGNLYTAKNLYDLLVGTPEMTPASLGDSTDFARDSTGTLNSSAIRMGSQFDPTLLVHDVSENPDTEGTLVYDGEYRIEFQPFSENTGAWSVSYIQ